VIIEARVTEWVNPDNEQPATTPPEFEAMLKRAGISWVE
jgi:hypothetical protein